MKALDKKLLRDIWRMKGQVFAIALVIVSGVSTFVMLISIMDSLTLTRDRFYQEYRFAEVFASLKRAPESLKLRISEVPGVEQIESRVVGDVKLEIKGFPEPVTARLVSIPETGMPLLNRLYIRKGRLVDPQKDNEVIVSEAFADAHGFSIGDRFGAIINGRWKSLVIVGLGLSPEFVLQVRPGALVPDYKRYAILWMGREALSTAYNMKGAFNDVLIKLSKGANLNDVIIQLDNLLDQYGGLGAYARKDQTSNRFLSEEFKQLQRSAEIFPTIFIAVAAFLLNVAISRTISTQREQIATLKAFGYSNYAVGIHYTKMVMLIVIIGAAGGIAVGIWFGKGLGRIYMEFYRFPYLMYELKPVVVILAASITAASALAGTVYSVWKAAVIPPAEAMQPEPPAVFRKTTIEHLRLWHLLSQPTKIIIRNIERRPVRSILSITGIALSCGIMIAATFSKDAVDFMVDVQFRLSQKEDMTVTFIEPTSRKALYELKALKGVEHAETEAKRTEAGRLSAEAAVKVAKFELDKARSVLQYSADEGGVNRGRAVALRSPVDGKILKLHCESEGVVNSGEALIDIGDPDKLEVRVEVLSADAVKIKPGTPVLFKRWGGEPVLSGMVRIIEPAGFTKISSLGVEEQRVVVIADIASANEGKKGLGDGYRVEASFVIWEGKDVLQIPASALFRKDDAWAVFVIKNKKAQLQQVEIGHRNGLVAEVLSGLTEGEEVIAHPDDSIKEGIRVRKR